MPFEYDPHKSVSNRIKNLSENCHCESVFGEAVSLNEEDCGNLRLLRAETRMSTSDHRPRNDRLIFRIDTKHSISFEGTQVLWNDGYL
jgi:hypothetical protein